MSRTSSTTRARLIQAALELFTVQGVTETTTRQIAELAQVNEVTLFRHFGNKQGLLLAVIEDSGVFTRLGESLRAQVDQTTTFEQALTNYGRDRLQVLTQMPELLRSVVGESGKYTVEHRQALGEGVTQANLDFANYLTTVIQRDRLHLRLSAEKLASLVNGMLFGYLVIELTSEFHRLWQNQEDFLQSLVELILHGAFADAELQRREEAEEEPGSGDTGEIVRQLVPDSSPNLPSPAISSETVADLPPSLVHAILQQAKKSGFRDYALAYVLFGAGLRIEEIIALERSHQISDTHRHLLQVTQGNLRQVPVNQRIMGKRYGSYTRNPLNQWLKNRKDDRSPLFVNEALERMSVPELRSAWRDFTSGLETPSPSIEQARQTWCVEMLMRGMNVEDLSILSGLDVKQLEPYVRRAREKTALDRAIRLDQKP
ncbi:MAG: TetR family transcriptional regulator [Coleofasciculus sp. G3-WIS-01]|uniref:TetR family transcriptional regulator n=1 Tax=Coleofasciculus sp. G3-WIS-01 TaxID=3069528 RepID=UPI0032F49480